MSHSHAHSPIRPLQATALNMSNMIGVGPFITIPLLMSALGGPQALLGWLVALVIVIADGLIWAELGAALPGSGGTYRYLREGFGGALGAVCRVPVHLAVHPERPARDRLGLHRVRQLPALRLARPDGDRHRSLVAMGVGLVNIALLYRRIGAIGTLTVSLWIGTLITTLAVIATGAVHFDARVAFDFPDGAFDFSLGFLLGLGAASRVGIYDYLGYYDICYIGDEVQGAGTGDSTVDSDQRASPSRSSTSASTCRSSASCRGASSCPPPTTPSRTSSSRRSWSGSTDQASRRSSRCSSCGPPSDPCSRCCSATRGSLTPRPSTELLPGVRPPPSDQGIPHRVAPGRGRHRHGLQRAVARHGHQRAAHHADAGPVHRADRGADDAAPCPARATPAVSRLAVSAAESGRTLRLGVPVHHLGNRCHPLWTGDARRWDPRLSRLVQARRDVAVCPGSTPKIARLTAFRPGTSRVASSSRRPTRKVVCCEVGSGVRVRTTRGRRNGPTPQGIPVLFQHRTRLRAEANPRGTS